MPEYLSIKDVAEHLSVEYKTVYRLVRQGEIPAAKVGGVYRIHRDDLDAYIQQQKRQVAPSTPSEVPKPLRKCGGCMRLLRDEHDVGGECAFEGCEIPICTTCWLESERYCISHRPSRTEKLKKAHEQLQKGDLSVVVTALQARQREKNYISRFDTKIQRITRIWHPLKGQIITPAHSWGQLHETADASEKLMQLLHTGFLEEDVEQGMPLNAISRYHIPAEDEQGTGMVLESRVMGHMSTFVEDGFDAEPATSKDLAPVLDVVVEEAEKLNAVYLVGLASPTGWTSEAQSYVAKGDVGSTFHHQLVLPCLVDLDTLSVIYNTNDERLTRLVSLFEPRLPEEEVTRVIDYVERALMVSSGVSVQEMQAEMGIDESTIHKAFLRLVNKGSHRVEDIAGVGQVIVKDNL